MSRWSGRGQVEPLAALTAVFAVGIALTTYVGLLDATVPTPDRNVAEPTADRVERAITEAGVVEPSGLRDGLAVGPEGYRMRLTLTAATRTWRVGAEPPNETAVAELAVSVRVGPGRIRPGRLRVEVWT